MFRGIVKDILHICNATLVAGNLEVEGYGFALDSRQIEPHNIFLAMKGEHSDGFDYVLQAFDRGAQIAIVERYPTNEMITAAMSYPDRAILLANESMSELLAQLATFYRQTLSIPVVAITGSSGKTTTKELTVSVLQQKFITASTKGNHNNHLGLPIDLLNIPDETEALVLEMGMSGLGEIRHLASIGKPHIAIITNVGVSHLGLLGTRQNIASAKAELIESLSPTSLQEEFPTRALLHSEDSFTSWIEEHIARPRGVEVLTYGNSEDAALKARSLRIDEGGHPSANITFPDGTSLFMKLQLIGLHNVNNALAALLVGNLLGVKHDDAIRGVEMVEAPDKRGRIVPSQQGATIIDDSYNANPESMRAALRTLSSMKTDGRRIAVVAEMKELGDDLVSRDIHMKLGECIRDIGNIDLVVCIGDRAKDVAEGALIAGMQQDSIVSCLSVEEAEAYLSSELKPGDLCLVKASRSMGLDAIVKGLEQQ